MSREAIVGESHSELHSRVVDSLGADIASGRLPTGHVLTLDGVGTQYRVSRSVAREAIRVLEAMGMVWRMRMGLT